MDVVLNEWKFEALLKHVKNWRTAGLQLVPIAAKVSLANMRPSDLAHLVNASIAGGLDARLLLLELQQVAALDNLPAREAAAIAGMRKKGVRVALARFGCNASVSHLRSCPATRSWWILPSCATSIATAPRRRCCWASGDLARRLRLACVACGVETAQQLAFLKKNGWTLGQGPLFGEPAAGAGVRGALARPRQQAGARADAKQAFLSKVNSRPSCP
jgi:EAL domain-containing protein (putative c-di-GMP-specific phosphodiesterase class I)